MTLKIGLIGCGDIMRPHVEGWKEISERAEIVAVADISEENAQKRVAQIGRPVPIYADYQDLLADASIDAVDIALPHHLHRDSIVAAAEAGKHVLSEKPLCLTLEEAADIARAVEESGVTMMAGHNQLFFPSVLKAKQMLFSGVLGQVYMIDSLDAWAWPTPLNLDKSTWGKPTGPVMFGWRNDPAKMGGGELIDTGYHPTYRLLFLAGEAPTAVSAVLGTYRLPLEHEDTANLLVKFGSGVTGRLLTSWGLRGPGARPTLFNIMAEAGQLWGEASKLYYQPVGFQSPAVLEFTGLSSHHTFAAEIAHFVDAITGGFEPLHSVAEATAVLRLILAAYESAETSTVVQL